MVWNSNISQYIVLPFPIDRPFCELTHDETEAFFQWFLSHIPERISYLSSFIMRTKFGFHSKLDLSPISLIPLWKWFLSSAIIEQIEKKPQDNCAMANDAGKELFPDYISSRSDKKLSLKTEYILNDIGMYLGQVFVKNNQDIKWTYYETPKADFFVNMPVLSGFEDGRFTPPFKMYFEPIHMASVQAAKLLKHEEAEDHLYVLYRDWTEKYTPLHR